MATVSSWLTPVFFVTFSVLMLRSTSYGLCPNDWIHLQDSCYKFPTGTLGWNAAKSACEALGSKLVVINSQTEQQEVAARITKRTWIGLYRNPNNKSQWLWVDGSPVTYTHWEPDEPNNWLGRDEDCTEMLYEWNDLSCYYARGYVCETTDIDECAVSNGGCSHKCVNTAGGYKCECPDPELSLALDNKTCEAPDVDVQCNGDNMAIIIPKSLLHGIDREHLRLLDPRCKANETSTHFFLTTPLTGCNTTRRHTSTAIVYSNSVLEIPVAAKDVVTRERETEIQFSCFYSKYGVLSSVGWKPSNRKLVFSDEGKGNFTLSLNMFPNNTFTRSYKEDDFPVAVVLRNLLFFEVSVTSDDKQLSIIADRCYATPTLDRRNPLKYEFISEGCPNDETVIYYAAPSVSSQRFSLEAFKFIADHPFVFVHCHVTVCNATDPDSLCFKTCSASGRRKREVNDLMTDELYSLAQGPIHLARTKEEEKREKSLDKNGFSLTFLVGMILLCVSCLVVAATALIIFKKTRSNSSQATKSNFEGIQE